LAALAAAPQGMPLSYCQAADITISQAASSSTQFFVSGCWIAWFLPIGRLKTMQDRIQAARPFDAGQHRCGRD
jgi:hypothetical protein